MSTNTPRPRAPRLDTVAPNYARIQNARTALNAITEAGARPALSAVRADLAATLGEARARRTWERLVAAGAVFERVRPMSVTTVEVNRARFDRYIAAEKAAPLESLRGARR
ncbi:hypothetical protein Q9R20_12385 [Microbacterium sp. PRF11]|uniref:hypothetical protein n=1 Tax=Microbacterium sp. PRF11 TaxID=2962593 RepID=UPI002881D18C|nr:hypothetical protein [Microbacterium sp. PRF11]MDT0117784.1 hypothetical protein [Microbacterium sp. PRF11]